MRTPSIFVAALLFAVAPLAFADSIVFTTNSSFTANVSSGTNDNNWAMYSTDRSGPIIAYIQVLPVAVILPALSFVLPTGDQITSITGHLLYPDIHTSTTGTGVLVVKGSIVPPDFPAPTVAPVPSGTGASTVYVDGVSSVPLPTSDDRGFYYSDSIVYFSLGGNITGSLLSPGVNWSGYLGGNGQVTIPYSFVVDVEYNVVPVPEPSTLLLLGTGIMGVVGAVRRKLST